MKLLRHLVAADVRRLRLMLAVWALVVAGNRVVEGSGALFGADPNLRESFAVLASVLWLAELLLTFVLVSLVVHAHPTVGTDAFWLTRPFPPRLLLVSKLTLLALALVIVPAIANAVLLAAHKMPAQISAGVIAQIASIDTVWLILATTAAALTPNLARLALLIGGALVTVAITMGIFIAVMMARLLDDAPVGTEPSDTGPTGLVVFNAVLVVAGLTMLSVQYGSRLRRRSIAVGVAGVGIAFLVSWFWPVPFLSPRLTVPDWARDTRALTASVDTATISTNTQNVFYPERRRQWSTVNGRVRVDGLLPGWTATVAARDAALELPGGETLESVGGSQSRMVWSDEGGLQQTAAVRAVLGVTRITEASPPPSEPRPENYPALLLMAQQELSRHAPATGHYRARIQVTLSQNTIDATLPLRPGATHQNGGYRLVLDSISEVNGDIALTARESRAASMWERRPWSFYTFYLRNRARGEAVELSEYALRGTFTLMRFIPVAGLSVSHEQRSGFFARALMLSFPPRYLPRPAALAVDSKWLADAELVIVRRTEEGSVDRPVASPAFPLGIARQISTRQ